MHIPLLFREAKNQAKCEIVGHSINAEDLRKLFEQKEVIDVDCTRCEMPVHLRIHDERDKSYDIIEEY